MQQQARIYALEPAHSLVRLLRHTEGLREVRYLYHATRKPSLTSNHELEPAWYIEFKNSPLHPHDYAPKDFPHPCASLLYTLQRPATQDNIFTTVYLRSDLPDSQHLQQFTDRRTFHPVRIFKGEYPQVSKCNTGAVMIVDLGALDEIVREMQLNKISYVVSKENEVWER